MPMGHHETLTPRTAPSLLFTTYLFLSLLSFSPSLRFLRPC